MQASPEDYRLTTIVMVASVVITLLIVSAVSTNSVEIGGVPATSGYSVHENERGKETKAQGKVPQDNQPKEDKRSRPLLCQPYPLTPSW